MVHNLKQYSYYVKLTLVGITGLLLYLTMPIIAFSKLQQHENLRTRIINGVEIQLLTDRWDILGLMFVILALLTLLVIILYFNIQKTITIYLILIGIIIALVILTVKLIIYSDIDLISVGIMTFGVFLSVAGLTSGCWVLKKIFRHNLANISQ